MLNLFFGDLFSAMTTVLVLAMLAFITVSVVKRQSIQKWGRLLFLFILVGTAVSGLSATRDAYMLENALFAPDGVQSTICSIAGGLIFLTGLLALFVRKQNFRKMSFQFVSALFLIQVITIEASRMISL